MPDGRPAAAGEDAGEAVAPLADLRDRDASDPLADVARDGDRVLLRGARSLSSGVPAFPARPICSRTGARDMRPETFGPEGTLYSFSTVHVSASRAVPYTLGYVDFPDGLRALALVRGEGLRCDMAVRLAADAEGWWVEPTGDGS